MKNAKRTKSKFIERSWKDQTLSKLELEDPQLAIERLGRNLAREVYLCNYEPLYVFDNLPGLPLDWEWRRLITFDRTSGRCSRCGSGEWELDYPLQAHHIHSRGGGGNHALFNLEALCEKDHAAEHGRVNEYGEPTWGEDDDDFDDGRL